MCICNWRARAWVPVGYTSKVVGGKEHSLLVPCLFCGCPCVRCEQQQHAEMASSYAGSTSISGETRLTVGDEYMENITNMQAGSLVDGKSDADTDEHGTVAETVRCKPHCHPVASAPLCTCAHAHTCPYTPARQVRRGSWRARVRCGPKSSCFLFA